MIPIAVLEECDNPTQVAAYVALWSYADWRTGVCVRSYDDLAKRARCSRRAIIPAIQALEQKGIVGIKRLYRKGGGQGYNEFRIALVDAGQECRISTPRVQHPHSCECNICTPNQIRSSQNLSQTSSPPPPSVNGPMRSRIEDAFEREDAMSGLVRTFESVSELLDENWLRRTLRKVPENGEVEFDVASKRLRLAFGSIRDSFAQAKAGQRKPILAPRPFAERVVLSEFGVER